MFANLAHANGVKYEVFLLAGQSNMDGRAKTADLTGELARYARSLPGVMISLSTGGLHRQLVLSKGFEYLQPGFTGKVGKEAEIKGNTVIVSSDAVTSPNAVRYGWTNVPGVNLFNQEGLPASPFRTDVP